MDVLEFNFATVQSMVQRVAYSDAPPSIGDYDCIVVDEAHRGYTLDKEMEEEELILVVDSAGEDEDLIEDFYLPMDMNMEEEEETDRE